LRDTGGIDSTTVAQLLSDLERGYGFSDRNPQPRHRPPTCPWEQDPRRGACGGHV